MHNFLEIHYPDQPVFHGTVVKSRKLVLSQSNNLDSDSIGTTFRTIKM